VREKKIDEEEVTKTRSRPHSSSPLTRINGKLEEGKGKGGIERDAGKSKRGGAGTGKTEGKND